MGGGESMPFLTYRCEGNSYRWKGKRWFVALVLGEEGLGCLMARDDISGEHWLSAYLRWHSYIGREFNLMTLSGSYKYSIVG
jgi:hypothetical protein